MNRAGKKERKLQLAREGFCFKLINSTTEEIQRCKLNWIQNCNALNNELSKTKRKLGYVVLRVTGVQGGAVCYAMGKIVFMVVKNSVYNDYML